MMFANLIVIVTAAAVSGQAQFNPSILQDTRDLPKLDGTFGFLYRTEDGIAHAAKADPGGIVHGRFTYTDPTGLVVNYNYNAGSGVTPKYNYDAQAAPRSAAPQQTRITRPVQQQQQNYQQQNYQQQNNYEQPQQNNNYQQQQQTNNYQQQQQNNNYQNDDYQQNNYQYDNNNDNNYQDPYDNKVNSYDAAPYDTNQYF